jgi:large subunit ribosomal protein L23
MGKLLHPEDIILAPLLTEETWGMMENKVQIRKAVEEIFKVKVNKVWTANVKSKPRRERLNQMHGHTSRWHKAIVQLAPGDRIDVMG